MAIPGAEGVYELSVPNYEVKQIYKKRLLEWVSKQLKITPSEYGSLARFLAMGELETFYQSLKDFLAQSASFYQTGDKRGEIFYNGVMFCLLNCLSSYYQIESEQESGMGRADAVLIPKTAHRDHAIVLEYKMSKKCLRLTGPSRSRFTADSNTGLCHSRQGTRPCQEGVTNLLSFLWQGRGHEA